MSYQPFAANGVAESFCRYGRSNLWYRGPQRSLDVPYVTCIGDQETYGRFVETPYAAGLERILSRRCINLGSLFVGAEALYRDEGLREIADSAEMCILQLPSVAGQTNRFYRVHPRRNDRFVAPAQELVDLFPEVDFTDIHFVRHLLNRLKFVSGTRFLTVAEELRLKWVEIIGSFLRSVSTPVILLWLDVQAEDGGQSLGDPVAIQPEMFDAVKSSSVQSLRVNLRTSGESDDLEDVIFGTLQQPIAEHMIGPAAHRRIAEILSRTILDM
ncbi:DUF6473 family protein [Ruegeria arenilitoris]|uniref:DUF6473 family protein n=1 Tax=Ruegeria arenilitoris TaxID=1173585 RepID=UPI0020C59D14|nr:DUF6473 family protein [Ruegeria arenilitoris]